MLTPKQKKVLSYIQQYQEKKGYSASLEEIRKHFRVASISTAHYYVSQLHKAGYLKKDEHQHRGIDVFQDTQMVQIPLLGTIAAGSPIEAIENKETIALAQSRLPLGVSHADIYALKVKGDSMKDENINDGDIVLVRQKRTAENGEKVVALIDNNEATLKTLYKERGKIRLQPANKKYEPIIIEKDREFAVQGVVVDVVRNIAPIALVQKIRDVESPYDDLPLNKIICGDAVKELKKLPDESVDLIVTDPPYGISRELNCKGQRLGTTAKLNFNFGAWDTFNKEWFDIALKKTKGWMMTFCAKKDVGVFIDALEKNGFIAIDVIVWQKPDPIPLNAKSRFLNAWEAIVIGKRPGALWNSTYEHNIIKIQAPKGKNRIHPTQKPVGLIKKLIGLTTKEGDIVLDPFMGSGTTAIACIETKRNYIGFEMSKQYWEQSKNRIEDLSSNLNLPNMQVLREYPLSP